jgi:hypothetical protein
MCAKFRLHHQCHRYHAFIGYSRVRDVKAAGKKHVILVHNGRFQVPDRGALDISRFGSCARRIRSIEGYRRVKTVL